MASKRLKPRERPQISVIGELAAQTGGVSLTVPEIYCTFRSLASKLGAEAKSGRQAKRPSRVGWRASQMESSQPIRLCVKNTVQGQSTRRKGESWPWEGQRSGTRWGEGADGGRRWRRSSLARVGKSSAGVCAYVWMKVCVCRCGCVCVWVLCVLV